MPPVALTIAGSDPSGGAGIQADLKTFHQFGVYGESAITLVTVQNTLNVTRIEILPPELVIQQIESVIADIPPAAAKTGALGSARMVEAVANMAKSFNFSLVVDPVMIAKSGARLLSPEAETALKRDLLPQALLVTPNVPEAEALTGIEIKTEQDMLAAAQKLCGFGAKAALVKGGHLNGPPSDLLYYKGVVRVYEGVRVNSAHTHGTGCTYSAAVTASLALGRALEESIARAKRFMQKAIETAPGLGRGHGPLNHFASVE